MCKVVAQVMKREQLFPLGWEHINLTGDFKWNMKQIPPAGQLRSLQMKKMSSGKGLE
jgi:hypothetical protein